MHITKCRFLQCLYFSSEEAKEFTPKYNAHMLSVPKECQCLFYYAEHDPDEYKKQGKDWMKVSNYLLCTLTVATSHITGSC